jgi:hypothetical protein
MEKTTETKTEQIKEDYRKGVINLMDALRDLRQAGCWPCEAQQIVYDLIKEKYNNEEEATKK